MAVYSLYGSQGPVRYSVCSYDNIFIGTSGILYSHGSYPSNYPDRMTCSVTIGTVSPYDSVSLQFLDVSMYNPQYNSYSKDCTYGDRVSVVDIDGATLFNVCGEDQLFTVNSGVGGLTVTFVSGNNQVFGGERRGFKALLTPYSLRQSWDGCHLYDFKCDNDHCIPDKLLCDGDDNCGDNSDERDCGTTVDRFVVGSIIGVIVIFIAVLTLIYCCCRKKSSRSRPRATDRPITSDVTTGRNRNSNAHYPATTVNPVVTYFFGQVNINPSAPAQQPHPHSGIVQPQPHYTAPPSGVPVQGYMTEQTYVSLAPNAPTMVPTYPSVQMGGHNVYNPGYPPPQGITFAPGNHPVYPPPPEEIMASPPPSYDSVVNSEQTQQ
ncbi:uncharacterized protein LOC144438041 [Glandiceps talaboti]